MSLADFIPVVLYALAASVLRKDLYAKMSRRAFALFSTGTIDVVLAGALKALYKLLYALRVCDFQSLDNLFFPLQSIGFLLSGLGMLSLVLKHKNRMNAVIPPLFTGTFLYVALMITGLGCTNGVLAAIAKKLNRPKAAVLFVLTFVCCFFMGYLSSRDFDKAFMNWIAEAINVIGQGAFLWGTMMLHKSGLGAYITEKEGEI